MSDAEEEIESIREQKLEELQQQMDGQESGGSPTADETPEEPIYIDDVAHFEQVVNQYDVVLSDFYADWCGPCKMLEPIVDELATETDAAMAKVDVDQMQELAAQYRVQGVPTMVLFVDGEVTERIVGVREKHDLERLIERHSAA